MKTMLFASFYRTPAPLGGLWSKTLILSLLLSALGTGPAFANEATDVARLLRNKQYTEALTKTDALLAKHPRDAQMRFYKGLILAEQNKSAEAIAIFTKLTEDFPDLPEPYNNLAVLYAANGQYEKAGAALDMAIHTNPTYATALANLGDVYARLASQAYEKALQLEPPKTPNPPHLTLVRTLSGNISGGAIPKISGSLALQPSRLPPAVSKPEPVQPPKAELPPLAALEKPAAKPPENAPQQKPPAKQIEKPVEKPIEKQVEKPSQKQLAADKAAARLAEKAEKEEKAEKAQKAEKAEAKRLEQERGEALALVNSWAKAWSNKDVKTYLAQYDADFQPPKAQSRKQWAEERRIRIEEKGSISVKIEAPKVTIKGTTATVRFRQSYQSDKLKINATKTLVLTRQGNRWAIVQERAGG
jgi:outer membrane biosynthesis protein TonB